MQTILVVEDDFYQRMILRMLLEKEGYGVLEAANGKEGLEKIEQHPDIGVVITDLIMPEMDGFEFIETLRRQELIYTYIIVLTSLDNRESLLKVLSLGADDYLYKPILPQELLLRVKEAQKIQRLTSNEALIVSMAKLAEYRSVETGYHIERVEAFCRVIAKELAHKKANFISIVEAEHIAKLSVLHDLGKVTVPDQILHKPGKLSKEEFEIMKSHTTNGGKIIEDILKKQNQPYLKLLYDIVMFHHEKYNGQGYPLGLKGEEIPLSARIVAIADVYDAVTSKRCYKDAISHEKAKEIIIKERGEHFDPDIVDCFLAKEKEIIQIKEKLQDEV
ncbi:MAG: response regulator [Desulfonauticus sp.]|nr:response regulator [Desulfonauticus sp.]